MQEPELVTTTLVGYVPSNASLALKKHLVRWGLEEVLE